ncbi:hypothetical protein C4G29_RS22150 [Vibrio parahaemolyticus]|nr:hypothetical protein [Vibrio parahaemolyticus]ELB2177762.1 hypothetical protein [Vibrio parahaemolyticus]
MTYCIAWKTETSAYILADSAVTRLTDKVVNVPNVTSFMERQGTMDSEKHVMEGAYKIYSGEDFAIGMSGDAEFAAEVTELLANHLSVGRSIHQAVELTINNFMDFAQKPYIEVVIAAYNEAPIILTLTNRGKVYKSEHQDIVLLGSPTDDLVKYTEGFYKAFKKSWYEESHFVERDEVLFARMLGLLQSYGIHSYTMEDGIGGTYSGIMVNENGLFNQPDTCFLISGENPAFDTRKVVSVSTKNNCLCIVNSDLPTIVIPTMVGDRRDDDIDNAVEYAKDKFDTACFKYVIFLNLQVHTVCIVSMDHHLNHLLLSLDVREDRKGTIGFIINAKLENDLNNGYKDLDDTTIRYYSYIEPKEETLSIIKENIEDIRVGKLFSTVVDKYKFCVFDSNGLVNWFYGNDESFLPFLKHYQDSEYLCINDVATDQLVCIFKDGELIPPVLNFPIDDIFEKIPDKKRNEDIFLFDAYVPNSGEPKQVNVLASSLEKAEKKAVCILQQEYGCSCELVFAGVRFYHPEFFWSKET